MHGMQFQFPRYREKSKVPIVRLGEGKESLDQHRCQDLENNIHPDEWNTDDADCEDTRGFGASICDFLFSGS
jgi:hypothetical protein